MKKKSESSYISASMDIPIRRMHCKTIDLISNWTVTVMIINEHMMEKDCQLHKKLYSHVFFPVIIIYQLYFFYFIA